MIPVISPAFRWAQSLNTVFLEVKFATRFDSPACLDLSDHQYKISEDGNRILISAMCKNDKKLLHYKLDLGLYDEVMPVANSEEDFARQARIVAKEEQERKEKA